MNGERDCAVAATEQAAATTAREFAPHEPASAAAAREKGAALPLQWTATGPLFCFLCRKSIAGSRTEVCNTASGLAHANARIRHICRICSPSERASRKARRRRRPERCTARPLPLAAWATPWANSSSFNITLAHCLRVWQPDSVLCERALKRAAGERLQFVAIRDLRNRSIRPNQNNHLCEPPCARLSARATVSCEHNNGKLAENFSTGSNRPGESRGQSDLDCQDNHHHNHTATPTSRVNTTHTHTHSNPHSASGRGGVGGGSNKADRITIIHLLQCSTKFKFSSVH